MGRKASFDIGKLGEEYVVKLLRNAGLTVYRNDSKIRHELIKWDIQSSLPDGKWFTVEVKYDLMEERTGNVAVEHFNTKLGKPSGIAATTADLWCFVFNPLSVFVARTADLKKFVATTTPLRHVSSGGDDNAAILLYSRHTILPAIFRPMDDLTPDELVALLGELLCTS